MIHQLHFFIYLFILFSKNRYNNFCVCKIYLYLNCSFCLSLSLLFFSTCVIYQLIKFIYLFIHHVLLEIRLYFFSCSTLYIERSFIPIQIFSFYFFFLSFLRFLNFSLFVFYYFLYTLYYLFIYLFIYFY